MKLKSSMKTTPILLLAILASFAATGHAANLPLTTPISTVPVTITKPGYYYLVGNIFFTLPTITSPSAAITVNATGPVVIDMRGFTLQGQTRYHFPTNDVFPTGIMIHSNNVAVINGTIEGFWNGVIASSSTTYPTTYLTGMDLEGLTFAGTDNDGSAFSYVNNSIVRNCSYVNNYAGIDDSGSMTGNTYINDKVVGSQNPQWSFLVDAPYDSNVVYSYTAIPSIPSVLK
jgi:hypothetical protein